MAKQIYFANDVENIVVEIVEPNTAQVGLFIFFRSIGGTGKVSILGTPPNEEAEYIEQRSEGSTGSIEYSALLFHLQTALEDDNRIVNATDSSEAERIANEKYENNEAQGTWKFEITFTSSTIMYSLNNAYAIGTCYELYVEEIIED